MRLLRMASSSTSPVFSPRFEGARSLRARTYPFPSSRSLPRIHIMNDSRLRSNHEASSASSTRLSALPPAPAPPHPPTPTPPGGPEPSSWTSALRRAFTKARVIIGLANPSTSPPRHTHSFSRHPTPPGTPDLRSTSDRDWSTATESDDDVPRDDRPGSTTRNPHVETIMMRLGEQDVRPEVGRKAVKSFMRVFDEVMVRRSLMDIPLEPFSWLRLMREHQIEMEDEEAAIFARRIPEGKVPSDAARAFAKATLFARNPTVGKHSPSPSRGGSSTTAGAGIFPPPAVLLAPPLPSSATTQSPLLTPLNRLFGRNANRAGGHHQVRHGFEDVLTPDGCGLPPMYLGREEEEVVPHVSSETKDDHDTVSEKDLTEMDLTEKDPAKNPHVSNPLPYANPNASNAANPNPNVSNVSRLNPDGDGDGDGDDDGDGDASVVGENVSLEELLYGSVMSRAAYGPVAQAGLLSSVRDLSKPANMSAMSKLNGCSEDEYRAACAYLSGLPESDFLVCYKGASAYRPAHYLAMDRKRQCLVIAIRGSIQLGDILTDLACNTLDVTLCGYGI